MTNDAGDKKSRILVVEDDEDIAYLLRFMLSRSGYDVTVASDGRRASEIINEIEPPGLVLLDIMLPYIDGFQLIALIREKKQWNEVPVVMLTAKTQERDIVRALQDGANDYILKPFQPDELMARVRRLIKPRQ